jgi:hypothetical protein
MVKKRLHCPGHVIHVDGTGEDYDVGLVHGFGERFELLVVRTLLLGYVEAGVATNAKLTKVLGQKELG